MILMGVVTGVRGVKGELRIRAFTDDPGALFDYGPLYTEDGSKSYRGTITGRARGQLLVRFDGLNDRNQAEAIKGLELFVSRDAFPEPDEDEYYHWDLVGLKAELPDGSFFGTVRRVLDAGAGVSLDITTTEGSVLVPFTKASVPVVNLAKGKMVIDPPDGLLEPLLP